MTTELVRLKVCEVKFASTTTKAVNNAIEALGFKIDSAEARIIWHLISAGYNEGELHVLNKMEKDHATQGG